MTEQKLEVKTNAKGYKVIDLKPKILKGIKGLEVGNYIVVTKKYVEGKEFVSDKYKDFKGNPQKSYSCVATYGGDEVSFWLNAKEHDVYKKTGGEGDAVKITFTEETVLNKKTGAKMIVPRLTFERV